MGDSLPPLAPLPFSAPVPATCAACRLSSCVPSARFLTQLEPLLASVPSAAPRVCG